MPDCESLDYFLHAKSLAQKKKMSAELNNTVLGDVVGLYFGYNF